MIAGRRARGRASARTRRPARIRRLGDRVLWLLRAVPAALVTAWAEPPPPRPAALRRRLWPTSPIVDLVVAADVIVAVVVYAGTAVPLVTLVDAAGASYGPQFMHLVAAVTAAPLLMRQRWPLAAWRSALVGLVWASFPLQGLLGRPVLPLGILTYLLCLYTVAARCGRPIAVGAGVCSVVALWVIEPNSVLIGAALVSGTLVFGHNVRERRAATTELAAQQQRTEQEQAARAVLEERARIARELHDVVAHHMSVVAIRAEATSLQAPDAPEVVTAGLRDIRATSLEALTEMRRILGVLRDGDGASETLPQPGLDRVGELVRTARTAGLAGSMRVTGIPRPVPPGVGLSAYRIVQESLSNAMQHAPGSTVTIAMDYVEQPAALRLRVENGPPPNGSVAGAPTAGGTGERRDARHGLVGMRERVAMLGGALDARPTAAGGFAVSATLPLGDP